MCALLSKQTNKQRFGLHGVTEMAPIQSIVLGLIRSVCFDYRLQIANGFMSKYVFFAWFSFLNFCTYFILFFKPLKFQPE